MLADFAHHCGGWLPAARLLADIADQFDGTADKSGAGVVATCKALGIPNTYKAIRAYLKEPTK